MCLCRDLGAVNYDAAVLLIGVHNTDVQENGETMKKGNMDMGFLRQVRPLLRFCCRSHVNEHAASSIQCQSSKYSQNQSETACFRDMTQASHVK